MPETLWEAPTRGRLPSNGLPSNGRTEMKTENQDIVRSFMTWATASTLALCLWIATGALDTLKILDDRLDDHEVRITVLEVD